MHRTQMKRDNGRGCPRWQGSGAGAVVESVCMLGLVLLVPVAGCAGSNFGSNAETIAARELISPDQENQLGLQVKQELETKQNVRYVTDPTVVGYVRGVADKVIALGKKDRPE